MATEFHKVEIQRFPRIAKRQTADTRYWKKFSFPIVVKEFGAVSHVDFCAKETHDFAVTSGSRVNIFDGHTHQSKKVLSRFKEVAYCGTFRHDGKLLVAGGEDGLIQLFDLNSRAVLRQFNGHASAVHVTKFLLDDLHIISASDDKAVKSWDIATEQENISFQEHEDYVRCGAVSQASKYIFVTGSYDHMVKLWDSRCNSSVLTVDHGSPVECLQLFPTGGLCISAGSNIIKVWDILGGGRLLAGFSNHQKTITSLCFDGKHQRLLSGSADRHLKIYDIQDYSVVHSIDYPSPILSVAMSPDDTHLVVGMSNGLLSIRHHIKPAEDRQETPQGRVRPRGGTYRYFVRGKNLPSRQGDFVVPQQRKPRFTAYDKHFRQFNYSAVLDSVLMPTAGHPAVVLSVLQELIRRGGLKRALAGKDEEGLVPILNYLVKNITNPRYSAPLIDVATKVLDIYASVFGQSPRIDSLFTALRGKIDLELQFQQKAFELLGALDTLFTAATAVSGETANTPSHSS